jgi:hypothetical protein
MSVDLLGVDIRNRLADQSPTLAAHEVAIAFLTYSRPLDEEERSYLLQRGISDVAIDRDPYRESGQIGLAKVIFSDGYFDFAEGGTKRHSSPMS